MAGRVINYYAGGNTALGFHSFYESNLKGLDRLFILKGGPGTGKSSVMKKIGQKWTDKGYDIEFLHCSSDNNSIDGVIIPALKAGIVDGTAPHVVEPKAPGAIEEYVNLGQAWDSQLLAKHKNEIVSCTAKISEAFQTAYATFAQALRIHDEWERIFISNMDFSKAELLTEAIIEKFIGERSLEKNADVKHRFFGAATPNGAVDFIHNLTANIPKRYFIKGRPGTGKSTMLKKIAAKAERAGFDVEIYHCGFDPNSLDMVAIRELGIVIFDSTDPHEYFPDRDNDEIIDVYKIAVAAGTDEKYAAQITEITQRYSAKMKDATSYLARAKSLHDDLEKFYVAAMDFAMVEELQEEIDSEISRMADDYMEIP
jgi:hypothetical protein